MSKEDPKVGDVVQLRSGSPKLTIYQIKNGHAMCYWFNHANKVKEYTFAVESLQVVDPQGKYQRSEG